MTKLIYVAHSKDEEKGVMAPQPYGEHPSNMVLVAQDIHLKRIRRYLKKADFLALKKVVTLAAIYHDLGKLDVQAQAVLNGDIQDKMINHVDAGVAYLLRQYEKTSMNEYLVAAMISLAHHIGLENVRKLLDSKRYGRMTPKDIPSYFFRDHQLCDKYNLEPETVKARIDGTLDELLKKHQSCLKLREPSFNVDQEACQDFLRNPLWLVLGLSILVDCDHGDTSKFYGQPYPHRQKPLNAQELIDSMDANADRLADSFAKGEMSISKERFEIRRGLYNRSKRVRTKKGVILIDGLVGTGKTFALMRTALQIAKSRKSDTIIGVLPYIALIDQSSDEYKKVMFQNSSEYEMNIIHSTFKAKGAFHRSYIRGFNAPINITTSVNFFSIILGNRVSQLKNFHKMVGATIFMDEFHAMADHQFWPVILKIMEDMHELFKCNFVLSSGTPIPYWEIEGVSQSFGPKVHAIVDKRFYQKMLILERDRMSVRQTINEEWTIPNLCENILSNDKSVFVILETRKKAIATYRHLKESSNRSVFLRFSGLAPLDRKKQLEEVKAAMRNGEKIILVATQGADIGLDLSFECGYKELSYFDSITQMSGRINRGCEFKDSFLHIFALCEYPMGGEDKFHSNPSFNYRKRVVENDPSLLDFLDPSLCQSVAAQEIQNMSSDSTKNMYDLRDYYNAAAMRSLGDNFKLINMPTFSILVSQDIYERLSRGEFVPYAEMQENVVNVIVSQKNTDIIRACSIPVNDVNQVAKLEEDVDEIEDDPFCLRYWRGSYDPKCYGIYVDPAWGLVPPPMLIT